MEAGQLQSFMLAGTVLQNWVQLPQAASCFKCYPHGFVQSAALAHVEPS